MSQPRNAALIVWGRPPGSGDACISIYLD
jgi:hypothetical protein